MKKIFATLFVMLCTIAMLIAAPLTADEKQQLDITQRAQIREFLVSDSETYVPKSKT